MNSKKLYALMFGIMFSCTALFAKTPNDSIPKNALDSIKFGKQLYETSCVRCHRLKEPTRYTAQEWPELVNKMQNRAKITDEQKNIMLRYLLAEVKK